MTVQLLILYADWPWEPQCTAYENAYSTTG